MDIISFRAQGIFNSYKIPVFKNYHKTYLTPPKTMIIGMLCNIMDKWERYFYETLQDKVDVCVVIESLGGTVKDLWWYKTLENKNRGKSVIRRERNFCPIYRIYLQITDELVRNKIFQVLQSPQNTPSLGQDDEIIHITEVTQQSLEIWTQTVLHSSFATDDAISFRMKDIDIGKQVIAPTIHRVYTRFTNPFSSKTDNIQKRDYREVIEEKDIVEFYNTSIQIIHWSLKTFMDSQYWYNVSFY